MRWDTEDKWISIMYENNDQFEREADAWNEEKGHLRHKELIKMA